MVGLVVLGELLDLTILGLFNDFYDFKITLKVIDLPWVEDLLYTLGGCLKISLCSQPFPWEGRELTIL